MADEAPNSDESPNTTSVDMTGNAEEKQAGRRDPTESETSVDVDLVDEETAERREEHSYEPDGERDLEDVEHPELRQAIKEAEEIADEEDEEDVQRVQVSEGEDPFEAIENEGKEEDNVTSSDNSTGVMDGVDNDELEDAMDMELNVRDDIDPEHFDYDDQDFSVFGGYGEEANVEYNGVIFHFVQPSNRKQEELINNMGGGAAGGGMQMSQMMESMIDATVDKPDNIGDLTEDWTPFERMGLGLQCMEFLGVDALGNM